VYAEISSDPAVWWLYPSKGFRLHVYYKRSWLKY